MKEIRVWRWKVSTLRVSGNARLPIQLGILSADVSEVDNFQMDIDYG